MRRALQRGFTLLEMIIIVVILGIASATVVTLVAQVGAHTTDNSDLQVGTQLLQECGEWIVAQHRRDSNFFGTSLVNSGNCYGLTSYGGFSTPAVVVSDYTGGAGCPTGISCKKVEVTVSKGGVGLNTLYLMLSDW